MGQGAWPRPAVGYQTVTGRRYGRRHAYISFRPALKTSRRIHNHGNSTRLEHWEGPANDGTHTQQTGSSSPLSTALHLFFPPPNSVHPETKIEKRTGKGCVAKKQLTNRRPPLVNQPNVQYKKLRCTSTMDFDLHGDQGGMASQQSKQASRRPRTPPAVRGFVTIDDDQPESSEEEEEEEKCDLYFTQKETNVRCDAGRTNEGVGGGAMGGLGASAHPGTRERLLEAECQRLWVNSTTQFDTHASQARKRGHVVGPRMRRLGDREIGGREELRTSDEEGSEGDSRGLWVNYHARLDTNASKEGRHGCVVTARANERLGKGPRIRERLRARVKEASEGESRGSWVNSGAQLKTQMCASRDLECDGAFAATLRDYSTAFPVGHQGDEVDIAGEEEEGGCGLAPRGGAESSNCKGGMSSTRQVAARSATKSPKHISELGAHARPIHQTVDPEVKEQMGETGSLRGLSFYQTPNARGELLFARRRHEEEEEEEEGQELRKGEEEEEEGVWEDLDIFGGEATFFHPEDAERCLGPTLEEGEISWLTASHQANSVSSSEEEEEEEEVAHSGGGHFVHPDLFFLDEEEEEDDEEEDDSSASEELDADWRLLGDLGEELGVAQASSYVDPQLLTYMALEERLAQAMEAALAHLDSLAVSADQAPPPASPLVIAGLPRVQIRQHSTALDQSCAICCSDFLLGEVATPLPCSHAFHQACIAPWLQKSGTCPVCRRPLPEAPPPSPAASFLSEPEASPSGR
ncbi:E3 ubiquitin-protein ligase Praja-2 [Polymixia lowei]